MEGSGTLASSPEDYRYAMKVVRVPVHEGVFKCPRCGNTMLRNIEPVVDNYCPKCGQHLDWNYLT